MSTINRTAGSSRSNDNFTAIFQAASDEYHRATGKPLDTHPFTTQLDGCDSPEAALKVFRTQAQAFSKFRKNDEKLMKWLGLIAHIVFTFSEALGEGIALVRCFISTIYHSPMPFPQTFSPAKTIFTGIGVLFTVCFFTESLNARMCNVRVHRQRRMLLRTMTHSPASSSAFTSSFNA